jgi:phage tail-like protein
MALGKRKDPYLSFCFTVEVDQQVVAAFSEVTGLDVETEVETFREGGVNLHEQQLAGPNKFPSRLVLKRGMSDKVLWSWHQQVARGNIRRKDVSILLLDSTGEEKWRWNFRQALPVKWVGPQFRASNAEIAIETLELVHKGLLPAR